MRKQTAHVKQLENMYKKEDNRIKGTGYWEKLPMFWFTLFMSYKCTRRCQYCYAFNQVGEDNVTEMDDKTFSKLLEWIPEVWRINNIKVNTIGFLGGEPLLRTDRIKKVMDTVYEQTDGMQGYLYTNGDLVDTVDWSDIEDIQWISTNIADTPLEETARRMKIIGEKSNVIGQTVVATVDDFNLNRLLEITSYCMDNGYRLRYQKDVFRGLDDDYNARLLKKYLEVCDLLEDYISRGYYVHTTFLLDTLNSLWNFESAPYPCGKRNAVVFPDGSVGPCIRDHFFKTGTIFDDDPMSLLQCPTFHYDLNREDVPDECRVCQVRTTCQAGCPHDKVLMTGQSGGKSISCKIHKEIIPRLQKLDELNKKFNSKKA